MTPRQAAPQGNVVATHHENLLHSEYGKSSKELIEFIGQLRALGYVAPAVPLADPLSHKDATAPISTLNSPVSSSLGIRVPESPAL